MILKFRPVAQPQLCHLTLEQLQEVAANIVLDLGCDVNPVTFSPFPPANTSIPWVQLDSCGGTPVGPVKTFQNGEWK